MADAVVIMRRHFTVVNLDRSYRTKTITKGLLVDENDQESMRTLLKAQHRLRFDDEEKQVNGFEPLSLSTGNTAHFVQRPRL